MRSLIAAIRNVLRAMRKAASRWKQVMVEVGGRMVSMLVPSGAPIASDELEIVDATSDRFGDELRELARQLIANGTPDPDRIAAMPADVARWLTVLDDSQLRSVMRSSDDELQSHLRGWKGLRGVPWSDRTSVDEWIAAQTGRDIDDPGVEFELAWRPA